MLRVALRVAILCSAPRCGHARVRIALRLPHPRVPRVFCGRARAWKRLGRCLVLRAAWLPTAGRRIEWSRCPTDVPYCAGLSPLLAVLAALIAGALGQQEECDILGKSEAVDEAEPHRHAGARTPPGARLEGQLEFRGARRGVQVCIPQGRIRISPRIGRLPLLERGRTRFGSTSASKSRATR